MNELRDRLQELADGYARPPCPPGRGLLAVVVAGADAGPSAACVLAGLLVIATSLGLLPALPGSTPSRPAAPASVQAPRSTAWFRATYLPDGLRLSSQSEQTAFRSGLPVRGAQSFRLDTGGEVTVSVHPDLQRLESLPASSVPTQPCTSCPSVATKGCCSPIDPTASTTVS